MENFDFKSIFEVIINFIMTILKFEFNFDLSGLLGGGAEEEATPEA